jgi:hypothetical protein
MGRGPLRRLHDRDRGRRPPPSATAMLEGRMQHLWDVRVITDQSDLRVAQGTVGLQSVEARR